jgi:hypothetical protein
VKVGNRQAPHALQSIAARQNPTPQRWGFCVSEPFLVLPALIHPNTPAFAFFSTRYSNPRTRIAAD